MHKNLRATFIYISLTVGVLLTIFGSMVFNPIDLSFDDEDYIEWNEGWQLIRDGKHTPVILPGSVDADSYEEVIIENTIPDVVIPNPSISLRLSMQTLRVEVDGEQIFELAHSDSFLAEAVGSSWQVVKLPADSAGKTIRIILSSPYKMSVGTLNSIHLGSKSAVTFAIFRQHFPRLFIAFFALIFGIVFLLVGFVFRPLGGAIARIIYLGWFGILVAIWLCCESRTLQFFFGNHFLITNLVFIAIMLVPMPLLMYLETAYEMHHKNLYPYLTWAFIINFFLCIFLQFSHIADFFETVLITHSLIGISIVYFACSAIYEAVKYKNEEAISNLISISVLAFFSALEIFNFYAGSFSYVTDFFAAGVLVYIFLLCFDSYKYIHSLFEKSAEAKHFERLANFDALTNGRNRLAFDNDINTIWKQTNNSELWLCFFDLNDLKMINDTFGHHIGDMALKQTYECISKAFDSDENCYRIGGDEFACIFSGTYESLQKRLEFFNDNVNSVSQKLAFPFKIATGYAELNNSKYDSIEALLIDADMKMYADKLVKKA